MRESEALRIAICDDEAAVRRTLEDKVKGLCPDARIYCFASGEELLLAEKQFDILFLDIQMPGKDGMAVARQLRKKGDNGILIFVTALEEYVFQAFDVGAFHYLVKPFAEEKLREVLGRAIEQWRRQRLPAKEREEGYIMVQNGGTHIKVLLDDIMYAEVFNRKVVLHGRDREIEYYGKLSALEAAAGENFFRPHRAYLVNLKYIEKYDATTIYLEKGTALMAKQNYPEFVRRFMQYNRREGR